MTKKNFSEIEFPVFSTLQCALWNAFKRWSCEYGGRLRKFNLTIYFGKNFLKVAFLVKKLLNSWFDEIFPVRVNFCNLLPHRAMQSRNLKGWFHEIFFVFAHTLFYVHVEFEYKQNTTLWPRSFFYLHVKLIAHRDRRGHQRWKGMSRQRHQ